MSEHTDLAWAAGLFEGEGCISTNTNGTTQVRYPQIHLGSTDRDVVLRFKRIVNCGTIYQYKGCNKPSNNWRCHNKKDCAAVIKLLLPFLGKRRKVRALQVLKHCT